MKRREFIALLGGAAAAWPFAARAQQREPLRRIGILLTTQENDPATQGLLAGFQRRLTEFGWVDKHNVRFERRGAAAILRAFASTLPRS